MLIFFARPGSFPNLSHRTGAISMRTSKERALKSGVRQTEGWMHLLLGRVSPTYPVASFSFHAAVIQLRGHDVWSPG